MTARQWQHAGVVAPAAPIAPRPQAPKVGTFYLTKDGEGFDRVYMPGGWRSTPTIGEWVRMACQAIEEALQELPTCEPYPERPKFCQHGRYPCDIVTVRQILEKVVRK